MHLSSTFVRLSRTATPLFSSFFAVDVCQPCQETKSDHRWSEVIPPDSGLTFAVIWDPEDGLIAFTGAELLDSSANYANSPTSPSEAFDNRSQVLTLGTLSSTNMLTETPTTLAFFRDTHQHLFAGSRGRHDPSKRIRHGARTQTSSTIGGVDVYLRGSLLGKVHKDQGHYSCFDLLEQEFEVKPLSDRRFMSEDAESLELRYNRAFSFFRMEQNISSRFSTTTTSTSSYVTIAPNVGDEDFASKNWSMLERPNTPVFSRSTKIPHKTEKKTPANL
ncbi:hypothetical protein ONZ45_g8324 [Pleurotus djamor]|nr:hypothetical protein ONZ45_g8324 [Pleurotus djamor]